MARRKWLLVVLALLLAGWAGMAVLSSGPPSPTDYHTQVMQVAQGALGAVRTMRLTGQADLDGRAVSDYVSTVFEDGLTDLSDAQRRLAGDPPPTAELARLRDELAPLLVDAGHRAGDLAAAAERDDRQAMRAAVDALGPLGDRLDDFVNRNR